MLNFIVELSRISLLSSDSIHTSVKSPNSTKLPKRPPYYKNEHFSIVETFQNAQLYSQIKLYLSFKFRFHTHNFSLYTKDRAHTDEIKPHISLLSRSCNLSKRRGLFSCDSHLHSKIGIITSIAILFSPTYFLDS